MKKTHIYLVALLFILSACNDDPLPTCNDGLQNGTETGIDCGGDCTSCFSCSDGILNGTETGIDCGGADCDPCYGLGLTGEAGGIIFYDKGSYSNGWRYLEAANEDSNCTGFSCPEILTDAGTSAAIESRTDNTETIIILCGTGILLTNSLVFQSGGFDDWYVPSDDELTTMYLNKQIIPNLLELGECGNYYSSTLKNIPGQNRFIPRCMDMTDGSFFFPNPGQLIRPIRQF